MEPRAWERLQDGDPERLGDYRLVGRLGEGGMGIVYVAEDTLGRRVAVKVMRGQYARSPDFLARFKGEVAAARRVRSFCTAPVLGWRVDEGQVYLVTEYVEGPDLRRAVDERGPFSGSNLEALAVGTATALSAIHQAGLVHRDFKPDNVLLSPVAPRVIDFGLARPLDLSTHLTTPGNLVGTPRYMAPEVLTPEQVTAAYDVFAWGGVMVFAATGRPPFDGDSLLELLHRITHDQPVLDGLPKELAKVVAAALAKDPAERPAAWDVLTTLVGAGAGPERTAEIVRMDLDRPRLVVCGPEACAGYAERLTGLLRERGLPVVSAYDAPGAVDRLDGAPALVLLMSPDESEVVSRALSEARRLGVRVFRVLLGGIGPGRARFYDARDGSLPGEAEIAWLRRLNEAPVRPAKAPEAPGDGLERLRRLVAAGDLVGADTLTTSLLLDAAERAEEGWLSDSDAARLTTELLRDVETAWAEGTDDFHGFGVQLDRYWGHQRAGSREDFRELARTLGWDKKLSAKVGTYSQWATRADYLTGFFPTLRNPSRELQNGWYDRWTLTVMAVHHQLRRRL
ncbi:serine/threonine-protein kinase [Sphaerisporangium aureirubrum]|uniref:Serine/threonine-protein kinase n=1 Tax=Sphaerisporangium aureirubrum TaxID=1544736 RepID=A0ABW1ND04_9ACTN